MIRMPSIILEFDTDFVIPLNARGIAMVCVDVPQFPQKGCSLSFYTVGKQECT